MALTGLQIQKLLPKTNCKECGSSTCMAFAMKLAAKKASLDECPYASEEAKAVLGAEAEPPVREVALGRAIGAETVLYRHEKTFVHSPLLAVDVRDAQADAEDILRLIDAYKLDRVGEVLCVDAISLTQMGDGEGFLKLVEKAAGLTEKPLILRAKDIKTARKAAELLKGRRALLYGVTESNIEDHRAIAVEHGHALALSAPDADALVKLCGGCREAGFHDLVLELPGGSLAESFQINAIARRAAIKKNFKPLGYPTIRYIDTGSLYGDTVRAVTEINKYGGICVLPSFDPAQLVTLMALRQNIYTDPQKPIQVEPKVYPIGEPGRSSPVFVTTNFSLTYFLVSGEIENSGVSAWLVIPECEGMSVLTAWAAGKFSGGHIAKAVKEYGLEEMVDTRKIVIPGYVSQISGELEEALPGWQVLVGPQEAGDIESFVKVMDR